METDQHRLETAEVACPICGGSGWKIIERDGVSGAERCECADAGREQRLEDRANIPPLYLDASVHIFEAYGTREPLKYALDIVSKYIHNYPNGVEGKLGLLFIGPAGTGKTHLAVATLRALIKKGYAGVFFDYQALLNHIRSGYDAASGTMDREAYKMALDTEVMVLDDLGAHRIKDFVEDTITAIITHRCNNRKATIFTTNLSDNEPGQRYSSPTEEAIYSKYTLEERIGKRAYSRLFEMCKVVRMPDVGDYRLKRR